MDSIYQLTSHAAAAALKRKIDLAWIGRALAEPHRTQPDPTKPVYNPSVYPVRVITVYFDRRLRGRI